jgi:hypothetical protein
MSVQSGVGGSLAHGKEMEVALFVTLAFIVFREDQPLRLSQPDSCYVI